jgi:type IV secretory pathway VirJ component
MRSFTPKIRRQVLLVASLISLFSLSSCSLLKRDRFAKNNGIRRSDFDLPVFFYPTPETNSNALVFILSGDGGWVDFEDQMAQAFANAGFNTVGFNSRSYFWEEKTPRRTANDLSMLMDIYRKQYHADRIILCGYSFGADVIPFIYNRLPFHLKNRVQKLALLSPFASSDFMVHTSDLLNIGGDNRPFKVQPEVEKIRIPTFCFYGETEEPKPLGQVKRKNFFLKLLPGDHRYEKSAYQIILDNILNQDSAKL